MADYPTQAQLAHTQHNGNKHADPPRLALRPREAALALGIGERLLWSLTNQGVIPHVRLSSRAIVYPVDQLRAFLAQQAADGRRSVSPR